MSLTVLEVRFRGSLTRLAQTGQGDDCETLLSGSQKFRIEFPRRIKDDVVCLL
jgi:hypothetical protein